MFTGHETSIQGSFDNNKDHHDPMKTIAKAFLNSRDCSIQERVYHILPELKRNTIFAAVYFVNTSLPEKTVQVLIAEEKALVTTRQ